MRQGGVYKEYSVETILRVYSSWTLVGGGYHRFIARKPALSSDLVTDLKNKIDEIEQKVSNIGQLQTAQAKTIY
ncbi:hypothetical protein AGMMS49953_05820 [Endomicrobiia bacterium]|nr:hypothetical protein AGMMS49953_05820 [Endomicrobiia bacterium]